MQIFLAVVSLILLALQSPAYALTPDQLAAELGVATEMRPRIERFLKKHHVKHPARFAVLILKQEPDPEQQKMWAAMLVKERGERGHISPANCVGPWQVNYRVWPDLCRGKDITDPRANLKLARAIFKFHLQKSGQVWGPGGAVDCYSGLASGYATDVQRLMGGI